MGKSSAPPPPDYTPIAMAAQTQQAMSADQLALARDALNTQTAQADRAYTTQMGQADRAYGQQQEAIDWAKSAYNADKATNDQIIAKQLAIQDESLGNARKAQARYEGIYQPLEDQAVDEARTYDSPDRKALMMGAASAGVAQSFEANRLAAAQNLESFGIDPSSTRYAALDAGIRTAKAAAQAGASNQAGLQVDDTARALRANAINVGRGLPSDINAGNQTAINAGQSGANTGLATTASGANTMGTGAQWAGIGTGAAGVGAGAIGIPNGALNAGTGAIGAGTQAIGAWGSALNNGYSNQIAAVNANNSSSSGIGGLLGTVAGFIPGLAEGGMVPGDEAIPTGGQKVPMHASPSAGRAVDDVPARLTAGEFVIPKDVVAWEGEKGMQKLIQKSREDRGKNSHAQPRALNVPDLPPAFASRPVR